MSKKLTIYFIAGASVIVLQTIGLILSDDKDGAISVVSHYLIVMDVLFLFLRPVR